MFIYRSRWREFVGEVGIIVLGVLIALGAEQVIETIHARERISATRAALNSELSRDLAAFESRINQRRCITPRIEELDRWARAMSAGQPLKLKKEIAPPRYFSINATVWQASDSEVGQMPVEAKLNYANIYAVMRLLDEVMRNEQDAWDSVSGYEDNKDLTREECTACAAPSSIFRRMTSFSTFSSSGCTARRRSSASGRSSTSSAALVRRSRKPIASFASHCCNWRAR
jgi:hypothetical protein